MNPHKIFRFFIKLIVPLIADVQIIGKEHLPKEGGFVLAVNHLGRMDAFLLHLALDTNNFAVPAAEKYEHHPIFGPLGNWLGAIWIDRFNADVGAVREIISRMQNGAVLVIAPEGTRSKTEALQEAKPGVAFLAARAGVPILPGALMGTEDRVVREHWKRFKRPKIMAVAGKPFMLDVPRGKKRDEALQTATDEIMCRIGVLMPEKYHGFYANHPRLKELQKEIQN
jgi:1-acyl-sn-glycerol-3-phosphate acyltransferase